MTSPTEEKLKPCPFCGARMEQHGSFPDEYRHAYVRGVRCPAGATTVYITVAADVAAWNRRSPSRREVEWQPIETAPKDGTRVDLWAPGRGRIVNCWFVNGRWWQRDGKFDSGYATSCSITDAAHWMPLPARPDGEAACPLHTLNSRREVLEEAAREIERYSEGLIPDYQVVCEWLATRIRALAEEE